MYNNYNPYYMPQTQMPKYQNNIEQQPQQQYVPQVPQIQQPIIKQNYLLGKSVDSFEVVRATDIPLDGSISYFPLTNGNEIITKQLLCDGTTKINRYKLNEETPQETINYATLNDIKEELDKLDFDDFKDEIKALKEEIKDIKKKLKNKE